MNVKSIIFLDNLTNNHSLIFQKWYFQKRKKKWKKFRFRIIDKIIRNKKTEKQDRLPDDVSYNYFFYLSVKNFAPKILCKINL